MNSSSNGEHATSSAAHELAPAAVSTDSVAQGRIVSQTRKGYSAKVHQFCKWCVSNGYSRVARYDPSTKKLRIVLEKLKTEMVTTYIAERMSNDNLALSSLSSIRSAIRSEFTDVGKEMPKEMFDRISNVLKGIKRRIQQKEQAGQRELSEGKDDLKFPVYKWINKTFLKHYPIRTVTFSVLSWNLMCKTDNTANMQFKKLDWANDALRVYVGVTRTNQGREKPVHPKHVYANPFEPASCPITIFGVYMLCNTCLQDHVFPGADPGHTFQQSFQSLRTRYTQDLHLLGQNSADLGVHSYQKGSATYGTSASIATGPQHDAVHYRSNWSKGRTQDRTFNVEQGDQYIGRVVSGLPPLKAEFGILPPHFDNEKLRKENVKMGEVLNACFPQLSKLAHMSAVLKNCLASVVYHSEYLKGYLPETHELFSTILFTEPAIISSLKKCVLLGYDSEYMSLTGVPPHVVHERGMRRVQEFFSPEKLEERENKLLDKFSSMLDSRGIVPGQQFIGTRIDETLEQFKSELKELYQKQKETWHQLLQERHGTLPQQSNTSSTSASADSHDDNAIFVPLVFEHSDGFVFHVPEGYKLPHCTLANGWRLWWRGDRTLKIRPFRELTRKIPGDLTKSYCEWKSAFTKIEQYLTATNQMLGNGKPTLDQVTTMFSYAEQQLLAGICPKKTKKRRSELHITTLSRKLRKVGPESFQSFLVADTD